MAAKVSPDTSQVIRSLCSAELGLLCQPGNGHLLEQQSEKIKTLFRDLRLGSLDTKSEEREVSKLGWFYISCDDCPLEEWTPSVSSEPNLVALWKSGNKCLRVFGQDLFKAQYEQEGQVTEIKGECVYVQFKKDIQKLTPFLDIREGVYFLYLIAKTDNQKKRFFCVKEELSPVPEQTLQTITSLKTYLRNVYADGAVFYREAIRLEQCQEAVCRIVVSGSPKGTGFVIGNELIITVNHVLEDEQTCTSEGTYVEFFYDEALPRETVQIKLDPVRFFASSPFNKDAPLVIDKDHLDFTIVALKVSEIIPDRLKYVFEHPITLDKPGIAEANTPVHLIHHPKGGPGVSSLAGVNQNYILRKEGCIVYHGCQTDGGSSGCPLLNKHKEIVAIHRNAFPKAPEGEKTAIRVHGIIQFLMKKFSTKKPGTPLLAEIAENFGPRKLENLLYLPVTLRCFIGRHELLDRLEEKCFSSPWNSKRPSLLIHLHGFAGLGKSETAICFANTHQDKFSLVWRIRCDKAWYKIDYCSLAKSLNIPIEQEKLEQVLDKVHTKLSMHSLDKPWLLLLDGIEELDEEKASFPERGGVVLSTSQTEKLWNEQETFSLEPFSFEETRDFFTNPSFEKRITNLEGLESLHQALQGWPILLSNAYTYILDTGGQITDYVQELESIEPLFTREKTSKYPRSLAQAFELTLRRLRDPESMTLLFCCAYLNPKEIPFSIFHEWQGKSPLKWKREVTGPLRELSIIHYQGESFRFHGLWQFFLRQKLKKEGKAERYFEQALQLLTSQIDGLDVRNPKNWAHIKILSPHLEKLIQDSEQFVLSKENRLMVARVSNSLGSWMSNTQGSIKSSLSYLKKSLEIRLALLGEKHRDTAESYNELGVLSGKMGKNKEALKYLQTARDVRMQVLGEDHSETAESQNDLGVLYGKLGKTKKELQYLKKALKTWLKEFGEKHPYTAIAYNNIGLSLSNLGEKQESFWYLDQSLNIKLELYGAEHSNTATSYDNLGLLLIDLGRYQEALESHQKALEIRQKVFGEKHYCTATSYHNLASSLESLGKIKEALTFSQKALEIRQEVFGEKHFSTATSYNNLGVLLGKLGENEEALRCVKKALKIRRKRLGAQHPDTALSYANVGSVLDALGNYQEALEHRQKALEIRKKTLGEKDSNTAISYDNVASSLEKLKRYPEALCFSQKALEIRLRVLGNDHHDTARTFESVYELDLLQAYLT